MPKISVIMPAYNAEQYIAEAMDSILGQTFGAFEFIILNDCSTDRTEEIILSYDDPRIVYRKNERNLGVAATLNRGLEIAQGEYIARMDADDISLPQRFEKQVTYMDAHPEVAVLGTAIETFGECVRIIGFSQTSTRLKVDLLFGSCFAHPSVMMRADVVRSLGGYDRNYEGLEDYDLWCRVTEEFQIATIPEILFRYREHPEQVTRKRTSAENKQRYWKLQKRIMSRIGVKTDSKEFAAWCNISKGDYDTIINCAAFFQELIIQNMKTRNYDEKYLEASTEAALLRYIERMPTKTAIAAVAKCGIKPMKYLIRRLRQHIRW